MPPLVHHDLITIIDCGSAPPPCSGTQTRYRTFYGNVHYGDPDPTYSEKMTNAIQLDVNSAGTQYNSVVDTMNYTYTK